MARTLVTPNGIRLPELHVGGRLSAAQGIVIQGRQVIVNQRVRMQDLDRQGREQSGLAVPADGLRGRQAENRTDPLPAGEHAVTHGFMDHGRPCRDPGQAFFQGPIDPLFLFFQVLFNIHGTPTD